MGNTILKSKRTNRSYETEIYVKQNNDQHIVAYIIPHRFLEEIYQNMDDAERPKISYVPVELNCFPGMPPMWAMKGIMEKDSFYMEKIGEFTEYEIRNGVSNDTIKMQNPLTICTNRVFDKLMIRYMQFEVEDSEIIPIYSSEEISITEKSIHPYQNIPTENIPNPESQNTRMSIPEPPAMSATTVSENPSAVMEAPQLAEVPYATSGTDMESFPEMSSPFPYINENMDFGNYPDMNEMDIPTAPDMDMQLPPLPGMERPNAPLKKPNVLRVSHDCQNGLTRIDTDNGAVFYNPFTDSFDGTDSSIDYDELYNQASATVGQPLQTYVGPTL